MARGGCGAMRAARPGAVARRRLDRLRQRIRGVRQHGVFQSDARNPSLRHGGRPPRGAAARRRPGRGRRARRAALCARQSCFDSRGAEAVSAVLEDVPGLASMREKDLAEVMKIETAIYTHPWTHGNFADSIRAGYACRTWRNQAELLGYFVLMAAAGEAHLLNLSVAARRQSTGPCRTLLAQARGTAASLA